jgi:hypothetical protein
VFGDPNHLGFTIEQPSFWHERCTGEQQLIRQRINQVRTDDFPAIEDDLDFINSQTPPLPTAERPDARRSASSVELPGQQSDADAGKVIIGPT